ncbi:MAG: polysaccharide deacetylase family protein [Actinobacteria bacterium]|nr:polysaccharide deacetylase family protein [Actinomycetota bacterium]
MPTFGELAATLASWRTFPGRERLEADPGERRVALTFDDGPDEDSTPAVLDALDRIGARATFFVVGEQLERHWRIARETAERGHELALHGYAHPKHDELVPPAARDEVARGVGAFEAAVGRRPRRMRPPYGRFSEHSYAACRSLGLEPVYWSAWGLDWEALAPARIADLAARDLAAGMIVLLHDSARYAERSSALPTAEALPLLAQRAAGLGLELGPIGSTSGVTGA